jgi:hypothetical protein
MTTTNLRITIGPERTFLPTGLQPFLLHAGRRLVVVGQLPVGPGILFPGVFGTAVSDDGGETWKEWRRADIPGGSPFFEGCAVRMRDGECLVLPWCASGPDEKGNWAALAWRSRDDWQIIHPDEVSIHLPEAKGGYDDDGHPVGGIFLHRSLIEAPAEGGGDELLMSAYCWFKEDNTPSTYRPSMNKFRSIVLASKDRGKTWTMRGTMAADAAIGEEGFNEPAMVRVTRGNFGHKGRLIAHLRTGSNKTFKHCPIYQVHSDDNGRTWSPPRALDFENVDPDLTEMSDGTLVASWGYRTPESRVNLTSEPKTIGTGHGNYLAFSCDGGDTWTQHTRVTDGPSTCYTCVKEIAPGKLIFIYDIGDAWQHVWIGQEGIKRSLGCRVIEAVR